jgi:hypothetical protein
MLVQLLPIAFLWLVPDGNPKDVVDHIDGQLAEPEPGPEGGEAATAGGGSSSSSAMLGVMALVAVMPPVATGLGLPLTIMLPPVLLLLAVPAVETFVLPELRQRQHAKSVGVLAEGLATANPVAPDGPAAQSTTTFESTI